MKNSPAGDDASKQALRQQAEARLARSPDSPAALSPEETRQTLHELQVHQIELEMQNEELRRAQMEIEAGQARYFDLYDLAPIGYCTVSENGIILEANLTAATLLGTARSALVEQPLSRFICKDDQDIYYLHRKKLFDAGQPQECELRLVKPDGTVFWAHLTGTAAHAEDGAPVCRCLLSDITARITRAEQLRHSEGLLQKIFDTLPIGLWIADKNGKLLRGNPAGINIWGAEPRVDPSEYGVFKARRWPSGEEIAPDDWALAHTIREGASILNEMLEIEAFDGKKKIILNFTAPVPDDNGGIQGAIVLNQDVTDRIQAEEALRESQERFQQLFEKAPLGYQALDSDGRFLEINQAWLETLGYRREEVIGKWFGDFLAPEYVQAFRERFPVFKAEGKVHSEFFMMHKDGSRRYISFDGRIGHHADGSFKQTHCILKDDTERKQAEEALRQSEELLSETERIGKVGGWSFNIDTLAQTWTDEVYRIHEVEISPNPAVEAGINYYTKASRPIIEKAVQRAIEHGEEFDLELEIITAKGNPRAVHTIGKADLKNRRIYGFIQDITEQKQAEEALRESEATIRNKLHAILEPDGDIETLNLADIIDSDELQTLMEDFHNITQIGGAILDISGNVLVGVGWADICTKFHRVHLDTANNCLQSDLTLASRVPVGTFKSYRCKNNMWDMVSPIEIGGKHLGNIYIGQFFYEDEPVDYELFKRQARQHDFDEKEYIAALDRVPRLKRETINSAMAFYSKLAVMISSLSYSKIKLSRDITERKQAEIHREMGREILQILNEPGDLQDSIHRILTALKTRTGCDAVGLRLQEGEDFPYFVQDGFPEDFLQTENTLIERGKDGGVCLDKDGQVCLECTCGLVLSGKTDPANPLFTQGGSCWTNDSFPLLELPSDQDPRRHPRNNCIHQGYASVALIPVRTRDRIVGLIQLNDKRKDQFTLETIEILEGIAVHIGSALMRKRAEEEREKLQAELTQSQKMESIGRLAGGVAHDFNNMLQVVLGNTEIAMEKVGSDTPLRANFEEIQDAARRSADLTRQLLAFARKQIIAPKVLDLNDAVADMLNILQRLIGEDIDLSWQPGAGLWFVKMDPGQAHQVLANLCVNARDAVAGVGKLNIETKNVSVAADYCADHAEATPGPYVTLVVSDDGCGMDQETLAHIFEPFFTTKGVGEGTGLGLSTVYGIVKQNGGFVSVYSEPGHGTTFRIYLPRFGGEQCGREDAETREKITGGRETILLVEDEASVREITARLLKQFGYTVLTAETPAVALRLAAEHGGAVELLISDVVMPGISGRDLAAKLTEEYPGMKCLFISGYTASVIAHRGILDEDVHFLAKPFTGYDIARKVREVLKDEPPTSKDPPIHDRPTM